MHAVGLAGEMQRAAADAAHMVIARAGHVPAPAFVEVADDPVPGAQVIVRRIQRLQFTEGMTSAAARFVRKARALPVGPTQTVIGSRVEARARIQQQHLQPLLRQTPGNGAAARTRTHDDGVVSQLHAHGSG